MNRDDIDRVQSLRSYPAVSILMPTHRYSPENRQDPIRLKNLLRQATAQLLAEFPRHQVEPLLTQLETQAASIDYPQVLDGLALFVSRDLARLFYLPFPVKERVVIDEAFATRDLMLALSTSPRYWVLVLSKKPTRLFEGWRETLIPAEIGRFPMSYQEKGHTKAVPVGYGIEKSKQRQERDRQFWREVSGAFGEIASTESLPVILVGTERALACFEQLGRNPGRVIATLVGNHAKTPARELALLVWPLVQAYLADQQLQVLDELERAHGSGRLVWGMEQVQHKAKETYEATLLVEKGFPGSLSRTADDVNQSPVSDSSAPQETANAVDELIETVLARKGRIIFVDDGAIHSQQRVAMILPFFTYTCSVLGHDEESKPLGEIPVYAEKEGIHSLT